MLGLGETTEELLDVLADLRAVDCDMLTLLPSILPLVMVSVARGLTMYPVIVPLAAWFSATTISRPLSAVEKLPVQRPVTF